MVLKQLAVAPQVYLALGTYYSITRPLTDKAITQVMVSQLGCKWAGEFRNGWAGSEDGNTKKISYELTPRV